MNDELKVFSAVAVTHTRHSSQSGAKPLDGIPVLESVAVTPPAAKYAKYRWCDYIELRCMTHVDHRFSRDALAEALKESEEVSGDESDMNPDEFIISDEDENSEEVIELETEKNDRDESFSATYFKHLRWRSTTFGSDWPFVIDEHAREIAIKPTLEISHYFYLHLLLSSLLKYCPNKRRKTYTGSFEEISLTIFRRLMPPGSEVHSFGAAHSKRYTGHLFERLTKLTTDIRGNFLLTQQDFPKNDAGDGGLDLVAWNDLKDTRDHIPIALAQCGCTADGWPNKMLEASPAKLGKKLITGHDWATYYFMPLDLTDERDGQMCWQEWRDINGVIVIDRLRLIRLADSAALAKSNLLAKSAIDEALGMRLT
ncbi:MAG: hypothetical protein NTZ64_18530 [Polaromonas sp.]|nr:hypothetical protein [Polaromonas sp.]